MKFLFTLKNVLYIIFKLKCVILHSLLDSQKIKIKNKKLNKIKLKLKERS